MKASHWPIVALSTIASAVNIVLPIVLVRVLTPEDVGTFRIIFLYLQFIPALTLTAGLFNGLYLWAGRGKEGESAIRVTSSLAIGLAILVLGLGTILAYPLASLTDLGLTLTLLFVVSAFGATAGTLYEDTSIALGKVWGGSFFYAFFEVFRTVAILIVAITTESLLGVLICHATLISIKTLAGIALGCRAGFVDLSFDWKIAKKVTAYATPVSLAAVLTIFMSSVDQYILTTWITAAEFAIYSVGRLAIPPILILEQSVMRVAIPELSRRFGDRDFQGGARVYREAIAALAVLVIPAVAGLIVFAAPIITLLFSSRYEASIPFLQVYALNYLFVMIPFDATARAMGHSGWILRAFTLSSAVSIITALPLTYTYGPYGALAALMITEATRRGLGLMHAKNAGGWNLAATLPLQSIARSMIISLILSCAAVVAKPAFNSDLLWFLVCGPIFGILYPLLSLTWKNLFEKREMRFLTIVQSVHLGGLERVAFLIGSTLKQQTAWQPYVLAYNHDHTLDAPSLAPSFAEAGIPVSLFKKRRGFSLATVYKILREVLTHDIRVVHTHDIGGLMYASIAQIISLGRFRILHTQHSFIHLSYTPKYRLYEKIFSRFPSKITAVSEDVRKRYAEVGVNPKDVTVISNGVRFIEEELSDREAMVAARQELVSSPSSAQYPELAKPHSQRLWILYMARLFPQKGQDHALAVWDHLDPQLRAQAALIFLGTEAAPGELERLQKLAKHKPDADRIVFVGGSAHPLEWLKAADVYMLSSESEGMPLGSLEAVGSGIPSLLSAIPGHDFLASFAPTYHLDEPQKGAQILEGLLLSSQNDFTNFRATARAQTKPLRVDYSINNMVNKYAEVLEEVRGRK